MAISKKLEDKLSKTYPPSSRIDDRFKGNDITFITNKEGDPVLLYIGKRKDDGNIKGEHYSRRLIKDEEGGKIIKSHWDNKGNV